MRILLAEPEIWQKGGLTVTHRRIPRAEPAAILALLMFALYGVMLLAQVPCLFQYFFHIPCPGCGMRDALCALLRLDFAAAFRYHPMVWSLPLLPVLILSNGRPTRYRAVNICLLAAVLGGFLAAYFCRIMVYIGS